MLGLARSRRGGGIAPRGLICALYNFPPLNCNRGAKTRRWRIRDGRREEYAANRPFRSQIWSRSGSEPPSRFLRILDSGGRMCRDGRDVGEVCNDVSTRTALPTSARHQHMSAGGIHVFRVCAECSFCAPGRARRVACHVCHKLGPLHCKKNLSGCANASQAIRLQAPPPSSRR